MHKTDSIIRNRKCLNPECKNREKNNKNIYFIQFSKTRILCKICTERALSVLVTEEWKEFNDKHNNP